MDGQQERERQFPLGDQVRIDQLEVNPHPVLARLRDAEPVSWVGALGGWLVTRHDLAQRVMRDSRSFTVDDPRFSTAQVVGPSMLSLDGPEHVRHRTPFAAAFRPAEVRERFSSFVETETSGLISRLGERSQAELRSELAGPLSVAVVARALGLVNADAATVLGWYAAIVQGVSVITAGQTREPEADLAFEALRASVEQSIETGSAGSVLAAATGRGSSAQQALSVAETVSNAAVLMFGGIDTTEGMICNLLLNVLAELALWEKLCGDPSLIPAAVEESLRLEPAAAVVDRYATCDVRLADADVRKGDLVIVSLAGANRDPAVFHEPNRFAFGRETVRQRLAFARGPHFCLGMDLARLEASTVLRQLVDGFPRLRLDPEHAPAVRGLVFRKPAALWVRWD